MWSKKILKNNKLKPLLEAFFEDYFSFDNKILKSLKLLLTKPGQLSVAFVEGKRASFVPPVRLFIFVAFVCIVLISVFGLDEYVLNEILTVDNVESSPEDLEFNSTMLIVKSLFFDNLSKIVIAQIPVISFFIYLFFYQKNRYYLDSIVFTLHLNIVFFIGYLIILLLTAVNYISVFDYIQYGVMFVYMLYFVLSAKTFYKSNYLVTLTKVLFLMVIQVFITALIFIGLLIFVTGGSLVNFTL